RSAAETEAIAQHVSDTNDVFFVPALSGLGAPHWDAAARGAFLGITGGTTRSHLVRAVLESIAFQVKEVVQAISASGIAVERLRVDGGGCQNNFLMQFQADLLGIPVERPAMRDSTVQGAAFAAGLAIEFWSNDAELMQMRSIDCVFEPQAKPSGFERWLEAVERSKGWAK
ncbi:MAG: glycerol kinase, partial [Leptolyngbyaceae cyanobacterium SM1_3_5]|nr:glycerol kinase [Leptolyngbyaceae cyanobacterium SM1_3_5]